MLTYPPGAEVFVGGGPLVWGGAWEDGGKKAGLTWGWGAEGAWPGGGPTPAGAPGGIPAPGIPMGGPTTQKNNYTTLYIWQTKWSENSKMCHRVTGQDRGVSTINFGSLVIPPWY